MAYKITEDNLDEVIAKLRAEASGGAAPLQPATAPASAPRVPKRQSLSEKYMGRQLTLSAVLGTDYRAKKVVLLDVRYKLGLICHVTTTTQTECFVDLGEYERGTRICFMATLGRWTDPKTRQVLKRLTRFKRIYVVP